MCVCVLRVEVGGMEDEGRGGGWGEWGGGEGVGLEGGWFRLFYVVDPWQQGLYVWCAEREKHVTTKINK